MNMKSVISITCILLCIASILIIFTYPNPLDNTNSGSTAAAQPPADNTEPTPEQPSETPETPPVTPPYNPHRSGSGGGGGGGGGDDQPFVPPEEEPEETTPIIQVLYTDESPYTAGGSIRVSVVVYNNQDHYLQVKINHTITGISDTNNDIVVTGEVTHDGSIPPGFSRTRTWSKPLPTCTPPGTYEWSGICYYKEAGSLGDWESVQIINTPIYFTVE